MYLYTGANDSTCVSSDELTDKEVLDEVRRLTKLTKNDDIPLDVIIDPYEASNLPAEVCAYALSI